MNDEFEEIPLGAGELPAPADETSNSKGELPPAARRALTELLSRGALTSTGRAAAYEAIRLNRARIEAILNDLNLELILDATTGIAAIRAAESPDGDEGAHPLLRKRPLSLYDTLLALVLRRHYRDRENAGDAKIVIDVTGIQAALGPFLPLTKSDALERKQLNGALDRFREWAIVAPVRGVDDQFEISPIIRIVINLEWLDQVLAEYEQMAAKLTAEPESGDE
ncbi:MAG: DUF4194 domain-containing protein [Sinimarinibacterium flocculans]|uniref:DUF4194 domain-containing protein n=1 Tax=Sinimarinibacterium flocculans TaxID=985250 RepID=UPI002EA8E63F|nr:DUF4194 domain-containing protein [Pseudomonadota bacterium]